MPVNGSTNASTATPCCARSRVIVAYFVLTLTCRVLQCRFRAAPAAAARPRGSCAVSSPTAPPERFFVGSGVLNHTAPAVRLVRTLELSCHFGVHNSEMARRFRIVLLWLSLLALPLHAVAGQFAPACMGADHRGPNVSMVDVLAAGLDAAQSCDVPDAAAGSCPGAAGCQAPGVPLFAAPTDVGGVSAAMPGTAVAAWSIQFGTGAPDRPPRPFIS